VKENKNGVLVSLLGATIISAPEEETTTLLSGLSVVVKSTNPPQMNAGDEEEEDFFPFNLRASSPLIVDNDDEINSKESSNRKFIAVGCVIGNRE